MPRLPLKGTLCVLVLLLCGVLPGLASTITVTSGADNGSSGTLRAAVASANSGDTINFSVTGTITLSTVIEIGKNLTIAGPGAATLAISGGSATRVFLIDPGVTVGISGLTIANGVDAAGLNGGGISNSGTLTLTAVTLSSNSSTNSGGAIYNAGTLTITNSTLAKNSATNQGGGIFNFGTATLKVTNSTLANNSAHDGGGIFNNNVLTVTNSTFSGNTAQFAGGGINSYFGTLALSFSTLAGNSAFLAGGLYNNAAASVKNSLFANNSAALSCANDGTLTSLGHNLADDGSCAAAFTAAGDLNSTAAGLAAGLAPNGGPTQTIALLSGSPAVNAIPASSCTDVAGNPVATDQRGTTRPQGPACDIGAFELSVNTIPSLISLVASDGLPPFTQFVLTDILVAAEKAPNKSEGCFDLTIFTFAVDYTYHVHQLTSAQASQLITGAKQIKSAQGCQ